MWLKTRHKSLNQNLKSIIGLFVILLTQYQIVLRCTFSIDPGICKMHQTGANNVSGHHCKLVSHQLNFALLQFDS